MTSPSLCEHCGAPPTPGLAACRYCKTAYPGVEAIACPACHVDNLADNAACAACRTPMSRGCLFCGAASSLASPSCVSCGEAFAGAEERKRQRDAQQQTEQTMHLIQGGVSVLGAVATSEVGGSLFGMLGSLIDDATKD